MTFQSGTFGDWGNARNQGWVNRMKEKYQTPKRYKQHLKEQEDASW